MNLTELARALRRRWQLLAVCTLVWLVVAGVYVAVQRPRYRAQTELFVATGGSPVNGSTAYAGSLFAKDRIKSYIQLAGTRPVLQPVIDQLKLPYTAAQLGKELAVANPPGTVLITVAALDPSPSRAQAIADAVGTGFARQVSRLETISATASPVRISVAQRAALPTAPVRPATDRDLAVALLLGLATGIAAAVVRDAADRTVRTAAQAGQAARAPVMGVIPLDPRSASHPMVGEQDTDWRSNQAVRALRTNLQLTETLAPLGVVLVTSCAPGDGATVTACRLALSFARAGGDIILVDADLRRPRLGQYLNLDTTTGLSTVLRGSARPEDVLHSCRVGSGRLRVVGPGPPVAEPTDLLASGPTRAVLTQLRDTADLVLVSASSFASAGEAAVLSTIADGTVVVARYGKTRRDDLALAADTLRTRGCRLLGTVLNMAPVRGPDAVEGWPARPAGRAQVRVRAVSSTRPPAASTAANSTSPPPSTI